MKISKSKLRQIIKEEMNLPPTLDDSDPGLPTYEDEPFAEYDLEAENQNGALAAIAKELGTDPEDPSLWEKILDAVRRANVFPRAEQ